MERWKRRTCLGLLLVSTLIGGRAFGQSGAASPQPLSDGGFTRDFMLDRCDFASRGSNPFFVLEPGYHLVLEGEDQGVHVILTIEVLDETLRVNGVQTRVVKERETHDGEVVEISKNYFAICKQTNSVVYFGEDVDLFEHGRIVSHEGSWHAGVLGAQAGLAMPGTILLGSRYFQEVAPGVAEDRAEIQSISEVVRTPLGTFRKCLKTRETSPLIPGDVEFKTYAPGIGLLQDETLTLVDFGF